MIPVVAAAVPVVFASHFLVALLSGSTAAALAFLLNRKRIKKENTTKRDQPSKTKAEPRAQTKADAQTETEAVKQQTNEHRQASKSTREATKTMKQQTNKTQELLREIERLHAESAEKNRKISTLEQKLDEKEQDFEKLVKRLKESQERQEQLAQEQAQLSIQNIARIVRSQHQHQQITNTIIRSKELEITNLKIEIRGLRSTLRSIDQQLTIALMEQSQSLPTIPPGSARRMAQEGLFRLPNQPIPSNSTPVSTRNTASSEAHVETAKHGIC